MQYRKLNDNNYPYLEDIIRFVRSNVTNLHQFFNFKKHNDTYIIFLKYTEKPHTYYLKGVLDKDIIYNTESNPMLKIINKNELILLNNTYNFEFSYFYNDIYKKHGNINLLKEIYEIESLKLKINFNGMENYIQLEIKEKFMNPNNFPGGDLILQKNISKYLELGQSYPIFSFWVETDNYSNNNEYKLKYINKDLIEIKDKTDKEVGNITLSPTELTYENIRGEKSIVFLYIENRKYISIFSRKLSIDKKKFEMKCKTKLHEIITILESIVKDITNLEDQFNELKLKERYTTSKDFYEDISKFINDIKVLVIDKTNPDILYKVNILINELKSTDDFTKLDFIPKT